MASPEVIIYHYPYSPYARRLSWYLALRGIPHSQCFQPPMLPRPDVSRLGIAYRRIPILSIGRDVYLDTRLQLPKLETLFPELPRLGASTPDQRAMERLLSHFTTEGELFLKGVQLLPLELPFLKNPSYFKDRGDFVGGNLSADRMKANRPDALAAVTRAMTFLETTLLADGRDWVLQTDGPSLADIEAIWPFHWMTGLPGMLPEEYFSAEAYPRVYAWVQRFQAAVSAARKRTGRPADVTGEEAARRVLAAPFISAPVVDASDPVARELGLRGGDVVEVVPTDTGRGHRDSGRLVGLDMEEVAWETTLDGSEEVLVRVHAPRHGFKVKKGRSGSRL